MEKYGEKTVALKKRLVARGFRLVAPACRLAHWSLLKTEPLAKLKYRSRYNYHC